MSETCVEYQCGLDETSIKKAELELNEIPEKRIVQLNKFKKWIISQEWISVPMGEWSLCVSYSSVYDVIYTKTYIYMYSERERKKQMHPSSGHMVV